MEQILASNGSKEEIASRVEALLAGSELSSSRGLNGGFDGSKSFVELLIFKGSLEGSQYVLAKYVSEYFSVRQKGTYPGIWA